MKTIFGGKSLAASAALAALCTAMPAQAQDASGDSAQQADSQDPQDEGNDIIVTAQRRSQMLIEVPQSVSVVGGDLLERQQATSFLDYSQLVPGLNLTQENPGETRVILRGINTGSVGSTVSIYLDEVPFGSSGSLSNAGVLAGDFDTFDIARIEVLRGPQGTLYGANSLGGTIKYVTVAPQLGEFEARGQAGFELVDDGGTGFFGNAVVNLPLGTTAAFRASGFYRRNAGYVDATGRAGEDINESDSYGGRASLLWQPLDPLSVRLTAVYQDILTDSPSSYDADPLTFEPVNAATGVAGGEPTRFERFAEYNDLEYRLYTGVVNWDFGFAALTSATGFSTQDIEQRTDISNNGVRPTANFLYAPAAPGTIGLIFQNDVSVEKFTQEVRLASASNDRFEWLVGAYYTHEDAGIIQRFIPFNLQTQAVLPTAFTFMGVNLAEFVFATLDSTYEEIAGFASVTVHLGDRFDITAGGRYSSNDQTFAQDLVQLGSGTPIFGTSSEDVFTWSIAPRFEINDRIAIYARAAKGYRPGGPNAVPPNAPPGFPFTFDADTLVNYELGIRGSTADRRFAFDAAVFYIDWDNIIINAIIIGPDGTPFGANANGQRARSIGAEGTFTLRPVRGLTAVLNLAYTDAYLRDDTVSNPGDINLVGGLAGDRLPYIPDFSASLSVDYEWALGGSALAFVGGNVRFVGDQPAGFSPTYRATFGRRLILDGYETVDLRAGVEFGAFSIQAWIRNLTDTAGLVSATYPRTIPADIGGANLPLLSVAQIRPRTVGLSAGFRF